MAAPTPVTRTTPTGSKLRDGHATIVSIGADVDIDFWEKEVTPPGIEGGEPIVQGDMFDVAWVTKIPPVLKDLLPITIVANYDPAVFSQVVAICNVATTITVRWPDLTRLTFYGYLRSFVPNTVKRGEQPNATVTIVPTNWDYVNEVEASPVVSAAA